MTNEIKKDTGKAKTTKKPAGTANKTPKKTTATKDFLDIKDAAKDVKKVMPAAEKTVKKAASAAKKTVKKALTSVEKTVEKAQSPFMKNNPKQRKKEVQVLKQLYQNADMGKTGIDTVLKKINNSSFKNTLLGHYEKFDDISQRISKELTKNGETQKDAGLVNKAMQWSSINANLLFDKSTEHLADMMIKGNNAGMIAIAKELNAYKDMLSDSANSLAAELLDIQQKNIEELKPYL